MKTAIEADEGPQTGEERYAAASARSLTEIDENALPETRAKQAHLAERQWVSLSTVRGSGLRPGIDLNSSGALLEQMEEQEPFP